MRLPRVHLRLAAACAGALFLPGFALCQPARAAAAPRATVVKPAAKAAAETYNLSSRHAIEMALARNYAIRVDGFNPAIAQARLTGARGSVFDPVLTARAQRSENNNPQLVVPSTAGAADSVRTVNEALDVNVRQLTPFGAILSVGTSVEKNFAVNSSDAYSAFAGLTATQPLLRDFGADAVQQPIRLAQKDLQISQWTFRQTVTDIITETAQAYDDLFFARENLRVAERSRDLAARLLSDNTKRVQLGVLTPLDISVARSQLAAREEAIITARQTVRENENALKLRVTDDVESFLSIRLRLAPPEERDPGALDDTAAALPHAFAFRPDYQQALLDLQRRQISLVFDRNQSRPRLDLSASFGSNGLSRTVGDSLAQAYSGENPSVSGGLNLTLPFPNREGRARTQASQLDVARALLGLKQLEQQIIVRLDNAAGQVRATRARIMASGEALRLAGESLAAEERKLTEGTSTTYVVLQLQNDLATAESGSLRARTDYQKALVEYERQAGRTLDANRVQMQAP